MDTLNFLTEGRNNFAEKGHFNVIPHYEIGLRFSWNKPTGSEHCAEQQSAKPQRYRTFHWLLITSI